MSDFDQRLRAALEDGARHAPDPAGLADAARRRHRTRRRRRATVGAVAAVLAVGVPTAVVAGGSDGPGRVDPAAPGRAWAQDVDVTCVEGHRWPVSAMASGSGGEVDDGEVRAALADLLAEAPLDAPEALRDAGAGEVPYVLLSGDDDEAVVGVGPWSVDGPGPGAAYVVLERRQAGLRPQGWGDCRLEVALPEGQARAEVVAPTGGVDPTTTDLVVRVREVACAGGRDPGPHLAEPEVVEDEDRVLVTVTSAEVRGGATCQTGPDVPVVVHLDEPLGERGLYDAGTWPPTPLDVAAPEPGSGAWTSVDRGWAVLDVPPGWTDLDCPDGWVDLGPADGCATETGVWLAESDATIDLCCPPGLSRDDDGRWSGYVHVGDGLVHVGGVDRPTALRLLGSVRLPGEDAVPVAEWERRETGGLRYEVPAGAGGAVRVTVTSNLALSARFPLRRVDAEQWGSGWRLTGDVGGWRVVIVAPSEALAELVAASVRRVS